MAGAPVSLIEVVRAGVESSLDDVFVAMPGKVSVYDPLTNTVVVKPMVKRPLYKSDGERVYEELPEIPFVPLLFPRAGNFAITLPVQADDPVLLLFCDFSLAEWRESGELSEPIDARRHNGWPVALVGLFPDTKPLSPNPLDILARTEAMCLGEHAGSNRVEIDATGIKLGREATEYVASGTRVDALVAAIMNNYNPNGTGDGAALKAVLSTFLATMPSMSFTKTKAL